MPTYTIVSSDQDPLGPGEIHAGSISVSPGDTFIIDPSVDSNITFMSSGGGPHDFDVVFNDSNSNSFEVITAGDLAPTVTVSDNTDLSNVGIDAQASVGLTLNVGDNVSFGKLDGSATAADTITIGNGFTATGDWDTRGGDDVITIGDDATLAKLKSGVGDDNITIGDRATFDEIDTDNGNDTITLGDDASGDKILAGEGDDTVRTGSREQVNTVDGELSLTSDMSGVGNMPIVRFS